MRRDDDICHNDTTTRFNETLRFNEQRATNNGVDVAAATKVLKFGGKVLKLGGQGAQVEHVDRSVDFSGFGSRCSRCSRCFGEAVAASI